MPASRSTVILALLLLAPALTAPLGAAQGQLPLTEPVQVTALAVAETPQGERVGAHATISVSVATGGSGHVFIDTRPLTGTDMQGSARIAARVASGLTGYAMENHDFFFVVRSQSPIIAGPSAGGIMTAAAVAALENAHLEEDEDPWAIDPSVMGTGTIGPDGSIGPVGGILTKAEEAASQGADTFLVPEGQGTLVPRQVRGGIVVEGEEVDVAEHCRQELTITCLEVGTIEELVRYMTGHAFVVPEVEGTPSSADYNETMAPLAQDLIDEASAYQDTWAELNLSDLSPEAEGAVTQAITQAHDMAQQARTHWDRAQYYSAASRAFSASIQGTHAQLMLDFFTAGRSLDHIADELESARRAVAEAENASAQANVTGMHTLYTVGAAQERVSDAEAHIRSASDRFNSSDLVGAMFDIAWATERAETVHWWLSLSDAFGPGPAIPVATDQLADDFIQLANEMVLYASQVLQLQQGPPRAVEQLQRAKVDDRRGFHAAAVVEAAQAQVRAALAVEIPGGVPDEKVNTSQEEAARAIERARTRGVEPVLAVAMFEFAGVQEDSAVALEFYRTARVYAGFSSVLTGTAEPNPSRFVGEYQPPAFSGAALPRGAYRSVAIGWFTIGVFGTLALGTLVLAVSQRGKERG